ncbi:MAG: holo-ACP synthase [Hyphomicrobiales bacterium]
MIIGIGTDIIDTMRIKKYLDDNSLLKDKLFSKAEQEYCDPKVNAHEHYAARFAAKEAFFKALGTGYRYGMAFHEIEVTKDELGKPYIVLHGKSKEFAEERGVVNIHLSLSHLKDIASAYIILEG